MAALGGCSNLLDIHALPDAADDDTDAATDAASIDGPPDGADDPDARIDAPMTDAAMTDGAMIDAAMIDAAMIDAPMIDAPSVDAAIDATPIDAGTVTIGEYAVLGSMTTVSGNYITARRFSVGGSTVVVAVGAYLKFEPANGHIKFAIYNDNANSPYTRRAFTGDITLDGVAGYNEIALNHTLSVAGNYWLVMATDMSIDIGSMDTNNVYGATSSLPYSGAFPTTYSPQPVSSATTDRVNLYLQVQP
jgi:hypothetical protein